MTTPRRPPPPLVLTAPTPSAPTTWTLVLDGYVVPSVNRLLTAAHWSRAHRIKAEVKERVCVARLLARPPIPDATGRRRVSVVVMVAGPGRLPDPDNILKCLLDALVVNGLIVDDSAKYVEIGEVTVERGKTKQTRILLEDIES